MIDKFKKWAKETLANPETLLGAPAYFIVGFVCAVFEERAFFIIGVVLMIYSVYVFFVNRISQEKKKKELIDG